MKSSLAIMPTPMLRNDHFLPAPFKPWVPPMAMECQFKCCHKCRPHLHPRSFLSLNAILSNDIPATAITGFGFHLQHCRPVADACVVRSIGLIDRDMVSTHHKPKAAHHSKQVSNHLFRCRKEVHLARAQQAPRSHHPRSCDPHLVVLITARCQTTVFARL